MFAALTPSCIRGYFIMSRHATCPSGGRGSKEPLGIQHWQQRTGHVTRKHDYGCRVGERPLGVTDLGLALSRDESAEGAGQPLKNSQPVFL